MSAIARNWTIYVCPACRHLSGKAGHIGCKADDGTPQPEPVEYVRAIAIEGAVERGIAAYEGVIDRFGCQDSPPSRETVEAILHGARGMSS